MWAWVAFVFKRTPEAYQQFQYFANLHLYFIKTLLKEEKNNHAYIVSCSNSHIIF